MFGTESGPSPNTFIAETNMVNMAVEEQKDDASMLLSRVMFEIMVT